MKVGSSQGAGRYHIQAEINMIPLIDVALVLLIIFMVISPILVESQMRVNVPKVTSQTNQSDEKALKVEIAADGSMAFQGKLVSKSLLRSTMNQMLPPGHKASLLIQADKDVAFENVVFVMDVAKQLKVEKLGVAVIPQVNQ
jgi:biopolymer transport protein ExbD